MLSTHLIICQSPQALWLRHFVYTCHVFLSCSRDWEHNPLLTGFHAMLGQVLRSRHPLAGHPGSSGKWAAPEQRPLEAAFLEDFGVEDIEFLRTWHSWASGVAVAVVARAVACAAANVFPGSGLTLPGACRAQKLKAAIPPERGKIFQLLGG